MITRVSPYVTAVTAISIANDNKSLYYIVSARGLHCGFQLTATTAFEIKVLARFLLKKIQPYQYSSSHNLSDSEPEVKFKLAAMPQTSREEDIDRSLNSDNIYILNIISDKYLSSNTAA